MQKSRPPCPIALTERTDAEHWINVLHRHSCADSKAIAGLLYRIEWLEKGFLFRLFHNRKKFIGEWVRAG